MTMADPFEDGGGPGDVRWTPPARVPPRWFGGRDPGGPLAVVSDRLPAAGGRPLPHAVRQLNRILCGEAARRGFAVFLVDTMDTAPDLPRPVDLLVGELRMFDAVRPAVRDGAPAIWLGSRPYWRVERDAVQRRRREVAAKRGFQPFVPPWERGRWNRGADDASAVLAFTPDSYRDRGPYVGEIGNSYLRMLATGALPENPDRGFLWLGTGSFVRKGLDLALEAFAARRDALLYVAGPLHWSDQRDFVWNYRDELFHSPGVVPVGLVPPGSAPWHDLLRRNSFLLLPSCAEGVAGAVLDGMAGGLLPVVTRECGVPVDDFGIVIDELSVDGVRNAIERALALPDAELRERRAAARSFALARYCVPAVTGHVRRHLDVVLGSHAG